MPTRRQVLGAGAALVVAPLASCTESTSALPPGAVRIPLDQLPDGARVVTMRLDEPVELIRQGAVVTARSLFCTHFGCRLAWAPVAGRYNCPCHGGAFDADGRPIAGPPTDPMRVLPVRMEKDAVVVMPRSG